MPFQPHPRPEILKTLADAVHFPFWLDDPNRPEPFPALTETINTDLVVIGAGFTGLWTALLAKETDKSKQEPPSAPADPVEAKKSPAAKTASI